MKNIEVFVPENFQFLEVKFSIYLNRSVFVIQSNTDVFSYVSTKMFWVFIRSTSPRRF